MRSVVFRFSRKCDREFVVASAIGNLSLGVRSGICRWEGAGLFQLLVLFRDGWRTRPYTING
ncbi:hypothetical protein QUB64_24375 [Microcoleus sp. Aus8_D2]